MPLPDDYYDVDPADFPTLCCHNCGGTGEVTGDDNIDRTCPECGGSGWPESESLSEED